MPSYTLLKLKNLTPLHIGTGKENYDFSADELQSDSLSAALCAIRAQQGKTTDLEHFLNSFTISSAFPFVKEHYFFPKMQGNLNVTFKEVDTSHYRKALKKIKYIDSIIWLQLLTGNAVEITNEQLQGDFLVSPGKTFKKPSKSEVIQRVTIPREEGMDAKPFYFDWTFFDQEAGLFCLIEAEPTVVEELILLFEILGENGIGTDRNVGGGKFTPEKAEKPFEINSVSKTNAVALLSTYIPTKDEIQQIELSESLYKLILRGGFIAGSTEEDLRHLRKKSIYMFSTGSILKTQQQLKGKVVDLAPSWNDERMHPVLRSGKPMYVPTNISVI